MTEIAFTLIFTGSAGLVSVWLWAVVDLFFRGEKAGALLMFSSGCLILGIILTGAQ